MLRLDGQGGGMSFAPIRFLLRRWSRNNSASTAVIAHIVHNGLIHNHCAVINVRHVDYIHVCDTAVVVEGAAAPLATGKSDAGVSVTVINSAIEADVRAPIPRMP